MKMKKSFIPLLVSAAMALSACNGAMSAGSKTAIAVTPSSGAAGSQGTNSSNTADGQTADSAPTAPAPAPAETQPAQAAPKPMIKWYPRGIGLPLTTDDPEGKDKKVAMLTFDDGPSDTGSTARILDVLAENNVKAMFFITGYGAKHRDLVEREFKEGHVLAPHTQTHANLTTLTVPQMRAEIEPVMNLIKEVTGESPKYFRPPYGAYNKQVLALMDEYHMQLVNWDDGSLDWDGLKNGYKDPNIVVNDVMKQLHRGAIILMHDTNKHTAEALPEIIRRIRAEGYEFVVLQ